MITIIIRKRLNKIIIIINKPSFVQKHTRIKVYKTPGSQFYLMEVKPGQFVKVTELELQPMKGSF
jgi:hypothetical protein